MVSPIRVGVIGCGEIAQVMHLRFITELPDLQLVALCDLSESVLTALGARYHVDQLFTSHADLLREAPIDAVLVATPDHAAPALAALSEGKHLLLEKPVALDLTAAAELAKAARHAGSVAMVGYMRVYDPGYRLLRERVARMPRLRLVRSHNFEGSFERHGPLFDLVRPSPAEHLDRSASDIGDATRRSLARAVGPSPQAQQLYWSLLMSATHDVSMLRDLLGPPRTVVHARVVDRLRVTATVEFERVLCSLEWDMSGGFEWWDQQLVVYGQDAVCAAAFADPYIPYLATRVTLRGLDERIPATAELAVANDSAFRREWAHFASCIRDGRPPRTTVMDGLRDIELIRELVRSATGG